MNCSAVYHTVSANSHTLVVFFHYLCARCLFPLEAIFYVNYYLYYLPDEDQKGKDGGI